MGSAGRALSDRTQLILLGAGLVGLCALPLFLGRTLPEAPRPTIRKDLHRTLGAQFNDVEFELAGEDGSSVKLHAQGLRLEAAQTPQMVSLDKAFIARKVTVTSADGSTQWNFERVELHTTSDRIEWFGTMSVSNDAAWPGRTGGLEVRAGRVEWLPAMEAQVPSPLGD